MSEAEQSSDFLIRHRNGLIAQYNRADVNRISFPGSRLSFNGYDAEISFMAESCWLHGGGKIHGAVLFKYLDEAAYFAAQLRETSFFLVTAQFQIHFLRPVSAGLLRAEGRLRQKGTQAYVAEARLFDDRGREAAFGTGTFLKSNTGLSSIESYDAGFRQPISMIT